jgi:hypothetical protein
MDIRNVPPVTGACLVVVAPVAVVLVAGVVVEDVLQPETTANIAITIMVNINNIFFISSFPTN